ncbi:MAG TPA: CpsB/CapC family capsule biosynthesis tyrosine phosphatase [Cyclobacteriaceae bacterium]|nr:CpsB/CapC family capsule biosynthesis tyrosine phosphatase [Cyclobacteriaceae bacterium]
MFSLFSKKETKNDAVSLLADIHSHLLPGLDDGVKDFDEALTLIKRLKDLGYKKLVTTPHIMSDTYRNDAATIQGRLKELIQYLTENGVDIKIEAAAEYYLDTWLINEVNENKPLLTFGDNYLLFEMNYMTEPYQLKDFIFKVTTQGYKPVLAHPERYHFMTLEKAEDLHHRGVLLQLNILSFIDHYSKPVRQLANQLVDQEWVSFLGSDCHHLRHATLLEEAFKNKYFKKALALPLLNNHL